jgi:CBS-domain-containing membrane protein
MAQETSTQTRRAQPTQARDVMTTKVITVSEDTSVHDIARLLIDNAISAVPVVNSDGVPIGMVSEGDLIGRSEEEHDTRYDWWLALVAGKQPLDQDFQARLHGAERTARDVMSAPVVTVTEQTDLHEIVRLLGIHRIKRVPVVRDGRLVGIVSRADLLRAFTEWQPGTSAAAGEKPQGLLRTIFSEFGRRSIQTHTAMPPEGPGTRVPERTEIGLRADDFRHLVEDFHSGEIRHREEARRAAAQQRQQRAKELIDVHVLDETWRNMLHRAREAAENGQTEVMLLRFPNELCTDRGRAINVAEHDWPATLRGEPAEIYLRWERELRPHGFLLSARVLEYPGGKPGDIGLFLVWGGGAQAPR